MIEAITNWFAEPFRADGNATNWILFVGLLVIATWFWQTVLDSIKA